MFLLGCLAIARWTVAANWPGSEGPLHIAFRIVAAGLVGCVVAHYIVWRLGIRRGSQQGRGEST
jgi:hypothetical protein